VEPEAGLSDRGFTGHRELGGIGLVHMRARLYSAELGRFVSPDILIPDPADPQSYNRYSYVHNNCLLDFGFSAEAGTQGMRDFGFQYQFEAAGIVQHRACQVN